MYTFIMSISILYPDLKSYIYSDLFPLKKTQPINGLGNILFRLAAQYSICKKYNLKINNYHFKQFIDYGESINMFTNYKNTIFRNIPINNIKPNIDITLHETNCHYYDKQLISNIVNNKDKNIAIKNSYLQSFNYFNEYEKDIKKLFLPDKVSLDLIYNKYPELKKDNIINVSIHLRLEWGSQIKYKVDYFKNSIEYIENKLKEENIKINYFVFSDNIDKAKNMLSPLGKTFVYCENNYDYIDIWIISLCKHNIICHSTFGWWGAYLNKNKDKLVLYPSFISHFYSKLTSVPKELIQDNYLPNDWISIDSS